MPRYWVLRAALSLLLVVAADQPAYGRSHLAVLGQTLRDGARICRAGLRSCGEGLRNTSFCLDLFAGSNLPRALDLHAGAALKLALPSYNGWKQARTERRRPRLVYVSAGVSNSLAFAGYNPLFGGWNANYSVPIHGGIGAGLFAGGPYTGFFVNTPTLLSFGGWVESKGSPPPQRPPPDPFAAVTLSLPGLSHLGLSAGVRLWIFSPLLRPLVRPLRRPIWWLHERRQRVQAWVKRRAKTVIRRLRASRLRRRRQHARDDGSHPPRRPRDRR